MNMLTPGWDDGRVVAAVFDPDLHHIDGPLIRALNELAGPGWCAYLGADIQRYGPDAFAVQRDFPGIGSLVCSVDTALEALHEAEATRDWNGVSARVGWCEVDA